MGSPPRVRGKELGFSIFLYNIGITPACAGKSLRQAPQHHRPWDHPRVRGEKQETYCKAPLARGSPPRARGKVHTLAQSIGLPGITPACAGKRVFPPGCLCSPRDHPRVRGEKHLSGSVYKANGGSPPRARGKAEGNCISNFRYGITPACAGKRLKHIPYLLLSCAKHLFTLQFCVDDLCQLAVGHSAVSLNIR